MGGICILEIQIKLDKIELKLMIKTKYGVVWRHSKGLI